MANANPSGIGSHVRNWNATKVSADGRADQNLSRVAWKKVDSGLLVRKLGPVDGISLGNLFFGESSDEHWLSIPDDLEDFSRRKLSDVEFSIGISVISGPSTESADASDSIKSTP